MSKMNNEPPKKMNIKFDLGNVKSEQKMFHINHL